MPCTVYLYANACGHSAVQRSIYCGGPHHDSPDENKRCMRRASLTVGRKVPDTVSVGSSFCDSVCSATVAGWHCCTCGGREVTGFRHPIIGLLVHTVTEGMYHAFCDECKCRGDAPDTSPLSAETKTMRSSVTLGDTMTETRKRSAMVASTDHPSRVHDEMRPDALRISRTPSTYPAPTATAPPTRSPPRVSVRTPTPPPRSMRRATDRRMIPVTVLKPPPPPPPLKRKKGWFRT